MDIFVSYVKNFNGLLKKNQSSYINFRVIGVKFNYEK